MALICVKVLDALWSWCLRWLVTPEDWGVTRHSSVYGIIKTTLITVWHIDYHMLRIARLLLVPRLSTYQHPSHISNLSHSSARHTTSSPAMCTTHHPTRRDCHTLTPFDRRSNLSSFQHIISFPPRPIWFVFTRWPLFQPYVSLP